MKQTENVDQEIKVAHLPETEQVHIDEITPYFNNPRRIPEEAVEAVRASIDAYGYVQPIVVDEQNVIIVGHTRHEAMRQLGMSHAEIYVAKGLTETQARQYRLVDNKTSELTDWNHQKLVQELREWDAETLDAYFPDVDLEVGQLATARDYNDDDVAAAEEKVKKVGQSGTLTAALTEVHCPSCFSTFDVKAETMPGLSEEDLATLKARAAADAEAETDAEDDG